MAIVTINRPEVRNALNKETMLELKSLVSELEADEKIQVVILTGAGEKAFAAGADLRSLKERSMLQTLKGENQAILNRLAALEKVTIAAINGHALGGGLELAIACDLRIAVEDAKIGFPEVGLGILPGAGGTQRLVRLVGLGRAKQLILTGKLIDAREAERIGLVNEVAARGQALAAAKEMAATILEKGPLAVRIAKAVINWGSSTDLNAGLALERLAQAVLFGTKDHLEGINSFLEKRKPGYTGS
ncbi:MAG: enoyl-CoA hydratase/isomerase family protein [Armatimonadetes bacterium]|nr:enoyl-CoA hydratase/isomerase family protein [Armatimonadota bacterium]